MTAPGMQSGDDRFPPLIRALHDDRAAGHTERANCWACEAVASVHIQRLAIDSSTLATLEKAMARYGAPDHLTPLSRFYWLLERQPSANAIRTEWARLDAERLTGGTS